MGESQERGWRPSGFRGGCLGLTLPPALAETRASLSLCSPFSPLGSVLGGSTVPSHLAPDPKRLGSTD